MAHLTHSELQLRMEDAKRRVQVGRFYTHYKDPSRTYTVTDLVFFEETEEVCVIYQADYQRPFSWSRRLTDFTAMVDWHGQQVPRFTLVNNQGQTE